MKNNGKRILAALLCLVMILGMLPAAVFAAEGPIKIACVGDSITYGHNPASPSGQPRILNENWTTLLGNELGSGYEVQNFGISGTTVMKAGDRPYWNESAFTQSKNYQPDIVILMLGTNDSKPSNWSKKDQFDDDLKALIEAYQSLDSKPKVYVATSATAYNNGAFSIVPSVVSDEIVPIQKQVAKEMGCRVIDINAATANMATNFPDNIHPNVAGHAAIFEAMYEGLTAKIKIACIGDSITYGHNPASPSGNPRITENWPKILGDMLGDGYDVRNFGKNGTTLSRNGQISVWNNQEFTDSKNFNPDIVIIKLGTNDYANTGTYSATLKELIQVYRDLPSEPEVYIATCAMPYEPGAFGIQCGPIINSIVPQQIEVAEEVGCGLIDVHSATANMPENFPDYIHPNVDGHRVIAETVYEALAGAGGCKHEYEAVVTEATCEEDGFTTKTCALCGLEITTSVVPALGHDWDEGVITKAPTNKEDGEKLFTCARCEETYTKVLLAYSEIDMSDIDFTKPGVEDRYTVDNQVSTAIRDGQGLYLITTAEAFEPCNGQISTFVPADVIQIPVKGDWTATMKFNFSQASAANGYYQFFGFYAAEGDDYQNLAGIRGGDGAMQNFLRVDGSVTADSADLNSSPGLASNGTYWWRIEKVDTTFICYRSADGEEFTEMFRYEDTGIDADKLILDAYTGMTAGYEFVVESIDFEVAGPESIDFTHPADASKFEIVNPVSCEGIVEGTGLTLVSTTTAMEPSNGQVTAGAPADLIEIPVEGDWNATLYFGFDQGSSPGYYEFFGFYAKSGDDYNNLAGIRGGDGAMQDFLRIDGTVTSETKNATPGLKSASEHWLRIVKEGTTYTCYRSADGKTFDEIFAHEETGIEAESIVIDAYSGMSAGYTYTLKSLNFDGNQACQHECEAVVTDPTCDEPGYTTYTCTICGESYVADEVPALGHDYVDGFCTVCGAEAPSVLDALEIPGAEAIRGNITLVEEIDGVKITWKSSNPEVVTDQAADGKAAGVVTRGEVDQKVILTASDGEETKEIEIIVKAAPAKITEDDYVGYLFGHFIGEGRADQEQIYFAVSEDGRNFTDMNEGKPVITSTVGEKGLRDPYMYRSPEGDRFFIVATDLSIYHRGGWKMNAQGYYDPSTTGSHYLVVYESTDLVHWSEPKHIKVAPENAGMAWAPEMIYHEESGQYIIFFASSIMDPATKYKAKPNAIYYVATRDFVNFSETKLLIDNQTDGVAEGGKPREIIDTTIIKIGDWYYSASKDGDNAEKNGGIRVMKTQDLLDYTSWVKVYDLDELNLDLTGLNGLRNGRIDNSTLEGPEFFRFNKKDWADPNVPEYGLFADQYAAGAGYLPIITTDIEDVDNSEDSWKILRPGEYSFDTLKKRHGTIINLTQAELNRVKKAYIDGELEECEHAYKAVVTAPTCTEGGYTTFTCAYCGDSYKGNETAALGHDYEEVITAPACIDGGYTTFTCSKCGDSYKGNETAALGHKYEEVVTAPTCTEAGYTTFTCSRCDDTYKGEEVATVGHKWDDGVVTKEPTETEEGVKTYTCTVCGETKTEAIDKLEPVVCPSEKFEDAPAKGHWAHEGIDYAVANELMNGVGGNKFNPGGTLTRAQLVTILYRVEGEPAVELKGTFSDVVADSWYAKAVEWAESKGIVNGVGGGKFAPDAAITREQIATILFRYDGGKKVEGSLAAYPDAKDVGTYAVDGMLWAIENKIITGATVNNVTYLKPLDSATREQIASIIMRYLEGK